MYTHTYIRHPANHSTQRGFCFMKMFLGNSSKFAVPLEYKNPVNFFPVFHIGMPWSVYVDIKKPCSKYVGLYIPKVCVKFWNVLLEHIIKHKPLISEECQHQMQIKNFFWPCMKNETSSSKSLVGLKTSSNIN